MHKHHSSDRSKKGPPRFREAGGFRENGDDKRGGFKPFGAGFRRPQGDGHTVQLDSDVAAAFPDARSVNQALRMLMRLARETARGGESGGQGGGFRPFQRRPFDGGDDRGERTPRNRPWQNRDERSGDEGGERSFQRRPFDGDDRGERTPRNRPWQNRGERSDEGAEQAKPKRPRSDEPETFKRPARPWQKREESVGGGDRPKRFAKRAPRKDAGDIGEF